MSTTYSSNPLVFIETHGCKLNQADSMKLAKEFTDFGFVLSETKDNADVYILNTCTVTHVADRKARQAVRSFKKKNTDSKVIVTGCYAERDQNELNAIPEIDMVLGNVKKKDIVNLERSMRLGDEIGGHLLSGHISATVQISNIKNPENNHIITFSVDPETLRYIFPKGYVALNGVSLTVGEVEKSNNSFNVYLIPETLRLTNLSNKVIGDKINLEIETQTKNMVDTMLQINKESIHG